MQDSHGNEVITIAVALLNLLWPESFAANAFFLFFLLFYFPSGCPLGFKESASDSHYPRTLLLVLAISKLGIKQSRVARCSCRR